MENINILFYLYCDWKIVPPTYRLYLNDELMTERTYIWYNDEYTLQENIPANIDVSKTHNLRIEQIGPKSGTFRIDKVQTPGFNLNLNVILD